LREREMQTMKIPMAPRPGHRRACGQNAEDGFTLVEALVAIIVLVFGLMAVTNLMLVAASSNSVANQSTAAVTSATRIMELLKASSYQDLRVLVPGGDITFEEPIDPGPPCATAVIGDFHCTDDIPGVGRIHTHWELTATTDPRIIYIQMRSEGTGTLSATRSRAEFTTFRACTNSDPTTGGTCPLGP
jgi:type II secretory pathway pseudopilin PulG